MSKYKTIRRRENEKAVHELTFSCFHRIPLLANDTSCRILAKSISTAKRRHRFDLIAFVFMPEHLHLLVWPTDEDTRVSKLLFAIKRPFSYRMKKSLQRNKSPLLKKLTVQQRPGVVTFRFWQEGPGYDRNLTTPAAIESAIEYIHMNPVRRGICEKIGDWKWSSARFYEGLDLQQDPDLPQIDRIRFDLLE